MTMTIALTGRIDLASEVQSLLVTRRDPDSRQYSTVGLLRVDHDRGYQFTYVSDPSDPCNGRDIPGIPRDRSAKWSADLAPIFANRVVSERRPDRPQIMEALGLDSDAMPFEVLVRSGGRRVGDTIELIPIPEQRADGSLSVDFFVHGVRYRPAEDQQRIDTLWPGQRLLLQRDPDNPAVSDAVAVDDLDGVRLGWVPTPLLPLAHALQSEVSQVLRVNPRSMGFHYRLLVRTSGRLPDGSAPPDELLLGAPL